MDVIISGVVVYKEVCTHPTCYVVPPAGGSGVFFKYLLFLQSEHVFEGKRPF